jgi:hypothetical protein
MCCLKEMLRALGAVDGPLPRTRAQLVEELVLHVLWVDLQPYSKAGQGVTRKCFPMGQLRAAAQAWVDYHKGPGDAGARQDLKMPQLYAPLWNSLKRVALQECGLYVLLAHSDRVYFSEPHQRPLGPHALEKAGAWRQAVTAPCPYFRTAEDAENARQPRSTRYVRSATAEQSMGAGAVPEMEVPLPEDEDALECPDRGTKVEWDALNTVEDRVLRAPLGDPHALSVSPDRLRWVKPERDGGVNAAEYAQALQDHPNPQDAAPPVTLDGLDPTQRLFADLVLTWSKACPSGPGAEGRSPPELCATLLGTAGTGKTTTLQAVLERLRQDGFGRVLVAAFTGVAASNVGEGARTLHDLFQLSKVNASSGELMDLQADDLKKLEADLEGLQLLVIDEVSMVSRTMLADVHSRLQEWRAFKKHPAKDKAFGGVGVVLAGDFGQLPPTKAEDYSLLNPRQMHGARHACANLGLRLFGRFTTVVRLRRIHRQPGASQYKESLVRLRDGAMTKEDHAHWLQHDLAAGRECKLTQQQRKRFEDSDEVTHLFAENAGAGERNGEMAGRLAQETGRSILRVASRDTTMAASRQTCESFGQLRRVVHLVEGAPVMIICNLRTPAGLVNGTRGRVVGAVLRCDDEDRDLRAAVSASDVAYVVVDVPKYCGPVVYPDHPSWVPIAPTTNRHKRFKGWERAQLPLVLAWGITIHKSQGLTFPKGAVVDFAHHPNTRPVANVGLAFVGMSRTENYASQGFRNLPDFWEFRQVLQHKLFKWRAALEEHMDTLHDQTMALLLGRAFDAQEDVRMHREWSQRKLGRELTEEELRDLGDMLAVRGLRKAPDYPDEPQEDRSGPRGGGGRKLAMGMKPPPAKKQRAAAKSGGKRGAQEAEDAGSQKRARLAEDPFAEFMDAEPFDEPEAMDSCGFDGGFDDPAGLGFAGCEEPDAMDFEGFDGGFDDP